MLLVQRRLERECVLGNRKRGWAE